MTPTDIAIYYGSWLFPSATFIYIILHEKYKYNRLSSYILANLVAATIMFPVEMYVFRR